MNTVLMSDIFELMRADYENNSRRTLKDLEYRIAGQLLPAFGSRQADTVTSTDILNYRNKRAREGAARGTINLELSAIKRGFELARRFGLIDRPPHVELYAIGLTNRRTGFFTQAEYEALLSCCTGYLHQMIKFAFYSGWRQGEILALEWKHYDEAANVLRLETSKNGHSRVLPITGSPLEEVIDKQKSLRLRSCLFVFHHAGARVRREKLSVDWRACCAAAGVTRYFHDLRRTAVRNLIRSGVHKHVAKQITGHMSDCVFERYDIVDETDLSAAVRLMGAYKDGRGLR